MLEIDGEAKISKLDVIFVCQENVFRLDIPVNPCSLVQVAESPQERHNNLLQRQDTSANCKNITQ